MYGQGVQVSKNLIVFNFKAIKFTCPKRLQVANEIKFDIFKIENNYVLIVHVYRLDSSYHVYMLFIVALEFQAQSLAGICNFWF